MGTNNRDWYRDWWRKKTGYTERAAFRLGHEEHRQAQQQRRRLAHSTAWRRNLFIAATIVIAIVALSMLR